MSAPSSSPTSPSAAVTVDTPAWYARAHRAASTAAAIARHSDGAIVPLSLAATDSASAASLAAASSSHGASVPSDDVGAVVAVAVVPAFGAGADATAVTVATASSTVAASVAAIASPAPAPASAAATGAEEPALVPTVFDPHKFNRYGFEISEREAAQRQTMTEEQRRQERRHENERMIKWTEMYHAWPEWKDSSKLKERIRKGIPDSFRVGVYQLILGSKELALQPGNRNLFQNLLNDDRFDNDAKQKDVEATIFRDLHRTLPTHIFFQPGHPGQQRLFNVLRAYSRYDRVLGYCQGIGMIVAVVLTYVTEEEAFWIMVALLKGDRHMMRGLYLVGLPLTMQYIFIYEKLLLRFEPEVAARLVDVPVTSYTSKWFMCIYNGLPFECMMRVWDAYVHEGPKVLFRVAIAIMRIFRNEILSISDEEFQPFMKEEVPARLDADHLIEVAFGLSLSQRDIEKFSLEYEKQNQM